MKIALALLITVSCFASCNTGQKKDEQKADSTTIVKVEKDLTKCMPRDTAVAATGVFVKYVKYDTTYGLLVGCKQWQTKWRDDIDCSFPGGIVPHYDWSSDKVVALKNGCGSNYCSKHVYFVINTSTFYRRENVLAHDAAGNLIAYFTDNYCLTIENISNGAIMEYTVEEIPACQSYLACVEKAEFTHGKFTFDIHLVKKDKSVQLETKSFTIPDRLYKN